MMQADRYLTDKEKSAIELYFGLNDDSAAEYNALKEQYPDALVGFEQNGQFEFCGEDARKICELTGGKLLERETALGTVTVTGFPREQWVYRAKQLWECGENIYLAGLNEDGTHHQTKYLRREEYLPVGSIVHMEGREFRVDKVDFDKDSVTLQDMALAELRMPIFREAPLAIVRELYEQEPEPPVLVSDGLELPGEDSDKSPVSIEVNEVPTTPEAATAEEGLNEEGAPEPAGNFRITDEALGAGGPKQKFARNIKAIKTLFTLEQEHRGATAEEQQVLSQYVGWGGLPDAFDPDKSSWAKEYAELKGLLSEEEYKAARGSVLNAHYTSPTVIRAIYDAVERMGFRTGNILEPSMGVGNFFGMLPESMADSRLYGVELDSITGRIAQKLYPEANIKVAGFETTDRRDFYDLAVGNVPFGNYKVNDKAYNKLNFSIHNYFFAKAIDQVRPGGIVAFVTSRYTLDSKDSAARKHIAERADLLGAIRLPNNAFRANAGTDVVSDIIFLQKRDRPMDHEPAWVQLGKTEDGISINSYFADHPEMILGKLTTESTQYGKEEATVIPIEGANLADQLREAVQQLEGRYLEAAAEVPDIAETEAERRTLPADPDVKNLSYTVVEGEAYYRENSVMTQAELSGNAKDRVVGMVELRQIVNELIDRQLNDYPEEDSIGATERHNERLNADYANVNVVQERIPLNVHYRSPPSSYMETLRTMEAAGTVSTRGLRKDATLFDEIIIDVNTMYFERNGGYEYAKKFYEEAYHFLERKFGSEYVVAAVMHADEINKAATSDLGKDVYHYHLHAVVIPVVDKDILWSKRCKDPALRGTVRETIHQVSRSKKWASNIPLKDEQGQPVLRSNGKPKYRPSYSILQDELVTHMQEHGFTDFQRGELGSTRENLTSLQYQIEKDKERLANIQERVEAAQTKYEAAWNVRKTESEIDDMGKKTITGKYTVSKEDYKQLTALAKEGITSRQEIHKLNEDISLYKKQYIDCKYELRDTQSAYAALRRRCEPFLQALKYFPQFAKGFAEKIADLLEHREARQKKEREEAKRNPHRASARRQDDQDLER